MSKVNYKPSVWVDKTDLQEGSLVDAKAMNNIEKGITDLSKTVNKILDTPPVEGPIGPQGIKGDRGDIGPSAYDLALSQGFEGTMEQWLQTLKGDRGERGIQGEKGEPGRDGAQGPKGQQGEKGERGPQGIQGLPGKDGVDGEQGPQGPRGEKGERGIQGVQGLPGEKGETGERGPKGDNGDMPDMTEFENKIGQQIENFMNEKISLDRCDSDMLSAIEGGEGTSFNLLSIPRDSSVTPSKIDNRFLKTFVDYSLLQFEYEEGAINSNGSLNNNIKNRYRSRTFVEYRDGNTLINNTGNSIFLFQYSSNNVNSLITKVTINKNSMCVLSGQGYLLVDLYTNKLESGNLVFLEVLNQKELNDKTVGLKKLADDTLNYLNNKVSKTEIENLKNHFDNIFEINGLITADKVDIPDKYNTGIINNTILDKAPNETFTKNNLTFKFNPKSNSVEFPNGKEFSLNVQPLSVDSEINNIDFTNAWEFIFGNESNTENERVVIINNCKFNSLRTAKRDEVNIHYIFNNCEIGTFTGSRCTFNNCKLGGLSYDATNPFQDCYFNDCYITELSSDGTYNWTNSLHLDGVQIFGYNNIENRNIKFKNCRFICLQLPRSSSTVYVNACIMVSLDYNNARNVSFEDCIINGGGYSIYLQNKKYQFENVKLKNIQVGCSYRYGVLYKNETSGAQYENVRETSSLYIGSVWKDDDGIHISVSNDTNVERVLKVITRDNEYQFTIPKSLLHSEMVEDVTTYDDFPIDLLQNITDDESRWVKCYDITDNENPILIKVKELHDY